MEEITIEKQSDSEIKIVTTTTQEEIIPVSDLLARKGQLQLMNIDAVAHRDNGIAELNTSCATQIADNDSSIAEIDVKLARARELGITV